MTDIVTRLIHVSVILLLAATAAFTGFAAIVITQGDLLGVKVFATAFTIIWFLVGWGLGFMLMVDGEFGDSWGIAISTSLTLAVSSAALPIYHLWG